jgi:hypothetical protein
MIRFRPWCALFAALFLTSTAKPDDKPVSPWLIDRGLTVTPQAAPSPSLKYSLLPRSWELKEGSAVPIYLRLVHEQSDASRKRWVDVPKPLNEVPVDKIPLDEARKILRDYRYMLRQLELGARRKTVDWSYTLDEGDILGILLPDTQNMRNYVPLQLLQIRVAIAEGDFDKAIHHLQTAFGFTRHVGDAPFLINSLVAIALGSQFASAVADLVERPGAPNLYWALTMLPRPFVDLSAGRDLEYRVLPLQYADLDDLDRERSPDQWDAVLHKVRTWVHQASMEGKPPKVPDWFPKAYLPEAPAAESPDLPAARRYVAGLKHLGDQQVAQLPPAQVLLLYYRGQYDEYRDSISESMYLPYPLARPRFEAAMAKVKQGPVTSEGHAAARLFLPALGKVMWAQTRLERNLAALRVVEALRLYAAAHDGKLPAKLSDITEVPLPDDPGTGKPFDYKLDGDTATVTSDVPGDPVPVNGIRFRVTLRK